MQSRYIISWPGGSLIILADTGTQVSRYAAALQARYGGNMNWRRLGWV